MIRLMETITKEKKFQTSFEDKKSKNKKKTRRIARIQMRAHLLKQKKSKLSAFKTLFLFLLKFYAKDKNTTGIKKKNIYKIQRSSAVSLSLPTKI